MAYHINSPAERQRVVLGELRVVAADHLVGPVEQLVAVLRRYPEQARKWPAAAARTPPARTKSPDACAAASAAMRRARSVSSARNRSTARGVKPRETILRSRLCSGSSIMIIDGSAGLDLALRHVFSIARDDRLGRRREDVAAQRHFADVAVLAHHPVAAVAEPALIGRLLVPPDGRRGRSSANSCTGSRWA